MARQSFTIFGRGREKLGTLSVRGRTQKAANARGRRMLRNIAAGFYDDMGFHPIRASHDYDAEGRPSKVRAYWEARGRKAARRAGLLPRKRRRRSR